MKLFAFLLTVLAVQAHAQNQASVTAEEIIEKSIAYSGGKDALSKIRSLDQLYLHLDEAGVSASIAEKRKNNTHLTQSIISLSNESQTTFYNGSEIVWVRANTVRRFSGAGRHELGLKTFSHLTLAYEMLKYSFTRLPDAKAESTDCFVLEAKNPDGYATVNYFDKTNFRHVMVVFPGGSKSYFAEDVAQDGIRFNKHLHNTDPDGKLSQMILVDNKVNAAIPELWFLPPVQTTVAVPAAIRYGNFKSVITDASVTRSSNQQVSGSVTSEISWKSDDMFEAREPGRLPGEGLLVRIVSWDATGYVCHVMGLAGAGTDEFKKL